MAKRKAARKAKKARKMTGRAAARKKTAARKARPAARKAVARTSKARRPAKASKARRATKARKTRPAVKTGAARKPAPRKAPRKAPRPARTLIARKAPALDRARRTVQGDDIVPTPPSSLDLDRTASAARTGRRQLAERLHEHNETSPALTAGDVDADWESAATVGDEAPGGDNPTPDQDVVDDIGRAVGVQYEDNEELKGEAKISKRDKHRWELDPASSEDFKDR